MMNKNILKLFTLWFIIWSICCTFDLTWLYLKDELTFYNNYFIRMPKHPIISSLILSFILFFLYIKFNKYFIIPFITLLSIINLCAIVNTLIYRGILNSSTINAMIHSNFHERIEFIETYMNIITPLCIIIFLGLTFLCFLNEMQKPKITFLFDMLFIFLISLIIYFNWLDFKNNYFPFSVIESYRDLYRKSILINDRLSRINNYPINVTQSNNEERTQIILVLGETTRRDYFNAFLKSRNLDKKRLFLFSNTFSNATNTYRSVPLLMSKNTTKTFNKIFSTPSIISYFKKSGYYTSYLTGAPRETYIRKGSILDSYAYEADTSTYAPYVNNLLTTALDLQLFYPLNDLKERIKTQNSITILHTMGSHIAYNQRYTKEYSTFSTAHINDTINTIHHYANTYNYKMNFLDSLVKYIDESEVPSLLVYVSDHGENLYDDIRLLSSHGGFSTSYQIEVPLLFYSNKEFYHREEIQLKYLQNRKDDKFQTQDLFHTLLSLANINTSDLDSTLSLTSPKYKKRKKHFIYDITINSSGLNILYDSVLNFENKINKSKYYKYQKSLLKKKQLINSCFFLT